LEYTQELSVLSYAINSILNKSPILFNLVCFKFKYNLFYFISIFYFSIQVNDISNKSVRSNLLCQALLWGKLIENQMLDYEHSIQEINKPKFDTSLLYLNVRSKLLKLLKTNLKFFY